MNQDIITKVVEAALLASGKPLNIERLLSLFSESELQPEKADITAALEAIEADCAERGVELREVSSGYRLQVREELAPWISRLWEEKPARYSRALLETLALIAYRQPITRGEIEDVRGVSVSSSIIKTLTEREWIKVVGHRDVPGKPAMYGTSKEFLDYFGLTSLDSLPTLAELRDYDAINKELDLELPGMDMPTEDEETSESASQDAGPEAGASEAEASEAGASEAEASEAEADEAEADEAEAHEAEASEAEAHEAEESETGDTESESEARADDQTQA